MARHSKETWLETGLDLLAQEGGPQGLTVERMCRATGRTKGSFYHHFGSAGDFTRQVMQAWRQAHTQDLIDLTEGLPPEQSLQRLRQLAGKLAFDRETAFRSWASRDPEVATLVQEVDQIRVRYLADVYRELGHDQEEAESIAWLEYALFLGLAQVRGSLSSQRRKQARELFERRLFP